MIAAIPSLIFTLIIFYFAFVGVRYTFAQKRSSQEMHLIRDLFKYVALFIAVLFTSFGISGILRFILDRGTAVPRIELARWMSFSTVGIPVVIAIALWIRRNFRRDSALREGAAWHLYLLVASTTSLLLWFIPLQVALRPIIGQSYSPRALSQVIVAFIIWLYHLLLLRQQRSLLTNIHRALGWFIATTGFVVSLISLADVGFSLLINIGYGDHQIAEAAIFAITSLPLALYYWLSVGVHLSIVEARISKTLGGLAIPTLFATIAATFSINAYLVWNYGEPHQSYEVFFHDLPSTTGTVLILGIVIALFAKALSGFNRDSLIQIYQYLISGATLTAGSVGFANIIAGLLGRYEKVNHVLFGVSLMLATCPQWFYHWWKSQNFRTNPQELHSPVRRTYLYFFIGIPAIFSLGAAVWLTYNAFKVLLVGHQNLWESRIPIAILATAALVAAYHLFILRSDRKIAAKSVL